MQTLESGPPPHDGAPARQQGTLPLLRKEYLQTLSVTQQKLLQDQARVGHAHALRQDNHRFLATLPIPKVNEGVAIEPDTKAQDLQIPEHIIKLMQAVIGFTELYRSLNGSNVPGQKQAYILREHLENVGNIFHHFTSLETRKNERLMSPHDWWAFIGGVEKSGYNLRLRMSDNSLRTVYHDQLELQANAATSMGMSHAEVSRGLLFQSFHACIHKSMYMHLMNQAEFESYEDFFHLRKPGG